MLAVGEYLFKDIDDKSLRMIAAMGNSVGLLDQESCGALTSGVLVIGALHGRKTVGENNTESEQLASRYRQRFSNQFGSIRCKDIRGTGSAADGKDACSELVVRATGILLKTLS